MSSKKGKAFAPSGFSAYLKKLGVSLLLSVFISAVLLVAISAIIYKTSNPLHYISTVGYILFFLSALACGFTFAKMKVFKGAISGLIGGFCLVCIMFVISLFFDRSGEKSSFTVLLLYLAYIAVAAIGGFLGSAKRVKAKHRRH